MHDTMHHPRCGHACTQCSEVVYTLCALVLLELVYNICSLQDVPQDQTFFMYYISLMLFVNVSIILLEFRVWMPLVSQS